MAAEELLDGVIMQTEMMKIGMAMRVLAGCDLNGIVRTVRMAHTIGPFIDPTKYRDALYRGDMDAMAELASALCEPVKVWNEKIAPKLEAANET